MENRDVVRRQYATAENLDVRIAFQQRFSQNQYGFLPWLMDQYEFPKGTRVLEVGCGTGKMWEGQQRRLTELGELVLTDNSEGMLADARQRLGEWPNVRYALVDVQELPYEDDSFDFVIANMMLYHVPDRPRALAEIRRVLRKGGVFACATFGENGIVSFMKETLRGIVEMKDGNDKFTLQNGGALLRTQFAQVERRDYPDEFIVDDADALTGYLLSMAHMLTTQGDAYSRGLLTAVFQYCLDEAGGSLHIPKEYGTFICR